MAHWLDTVCYPFDHAVLGAIHRFAEATNGFFNLPMEIISFLAHDGICMILLGLILLCFRRTRRVGVCVLGAIVVGALITNVTLKNLVARPRPYADDTRVFYDWWQWVGAHRESVNSFPSGHTTSATAAMTAIFLTTNKKYSWTALIFAVLMGISRMYLVVHYATDVLGGFVAGAVGAVAALYLTRLVYRLLERHSDKKFCRFVLDFDIIAILRRKSTGENAGGKGE